MFPEIMLLGRSRSDVWRRPVGHGVVPCDENLSEFSGNNGVLMTSRDLAIRPGGQSRRESHRSSTERVTVGQSVTGAVGRIGGRDLSRNGTLWSVLFEIDRSVLRTIQTSLGRSYRWTGD